jgi:hypothetical protein
MYNFKLHLYGHSQIPIKQIINKQIIEYNIIDSKIVNKQINVIDEDEYSNIAFITLTNTGYINYTLNCIQSLKNIKMEKQLKVYCIGNDGYSILENNNVLCELINDKNTNLKNFISFNSTNWSDITYYKFEILYNNLLNNKYVCITDGDIVFENNQMFDYLLNNIKDNDLLIQSEGIDTKELCSGFMFIKSNKNTISFFNPLNYKMYKKDTRWNDQLYINNNKHRIKFKKLPLYLFPTGKFYYDFNKNINNPYLIHFNWIIGNNKKQKMLQYNKWYIL